MHTLSGVYFVAALALGLPASQRSFFPRPGPLQGAGRGPAEPESIQLEDWPLTPTSEATEVHGWASAFGFRLSDRDFQALSESIDSQDAIYFGFELASVAPGDWHISIVDARAPDRRIGTFRSRTWDNREYVVLAIHFSADSRAQLSWFRIKSSFIKRVWHEDVPEWALRHTMRASTLRGVVAPTGVIVDV